MTAPWYLVVQWSPSYTARRRSRVMVRCAVCIGATNQPVIAVTPEIIGELAWHSACCERCGVKVNDPRLLITLQRAGFSCDS